jgi:hypothetical protein
MLLYATLVRGNIDMKISITFVGLYLVYVAVVFIQDKYCQASDSKADKMLVELNHISTKQKHIGEEFEDQVAITSSTGASVEYDYDCSGMNEEFSATYYK